MNSGIYQLIIKVSKSIHIPVGKLGMLKFRRGIYVYTGSAKTNLIKRINRHLSTDKKVHWHIDYLLANENVQIIKILVVTDEVFSECELNQLVYELSSKDNDLKGFGASDCRKCNSHLQKFAVPYKRYLKAMLTIQKATIYDTNQA